ncbi:Cytochrome P450 [Penicillium macrosclerotiorum]|uniref:Cytochrome P450 n=1 Tax=Penicillium macrosclerotiorum TaxID=303699 RepID=UPI0025495FF7|nr:Cytochrome P450 [Penicillium macrosclerotiorum]KAJ5682645.1 Cytochrome P450 [Penicillium macrosclerotiorum]
MIDFTIAAVSIVAVFAIYSIQVARKLSGIPGPFVARFTDYWKIYHMVKGDWAETICWWHQRHGPLIRIGPNALSVGDPTEVPQIYQTNPLKLLKKGHMYRGLTAWYKGRDVSGIEGIMDEGEHASIKKVVGQSFSWASVLDYEHLMDRSTMEFMDICQKLEVLDLNKWISYYTFDTMNGIAFSTDLGCMRQGTDVGGVLKTVEAVSGLWTYVAAAPTLFMWVARALSFFIGPSGPLVGLCLDRIRSRTENMQTEAYSESKRLDLLGVFLEARRSNPSMISHEKVIGLTLTTLLTGSETTSINLAWTVFFLLQNQTSLARLQEEIKTADLSYPPSLKDLCRLSYLSAVIKEGTRCASTVQLNLERIVPQGGMNLCDRYIPAGTTVGCHQRVIHLNQNVYGYDAAIFRPERWIESSEEVQRSMDRSGMWFGSGKHMCLGQHFARAGMMKLLSTMLMRFKVRFNAVILFLLIYELIQYRFPPSIPKPSKSLPTALYESQQALITSESTRGKTAIKLKK